MTRNFKTSKKYRMTYKYYDDKGKVIDEILPTDEKREMLIAILHKMDDDELDANRREDYKAPVRYQSYSALADSEMDDHNPFLVDTTPNPLEQLLFDLEEQEHQEKLEKLKEAITKLLPKQQELIHKFYVEKKTKVAIAKEENVTEAAIRNRLNKILKRIKSFLK